MIQPPASGTDEGALYAGGVFNLKKGDHIILTTADPADLYMFTYHCYFGAYMI